MGIPSPLNVNDLVVQGGLLNSSPSIAQTEAAQASGYVTHVGTINQDFCFTYSPTPFGGTTVQRFFATDVLIADVALYTALNAISAPITWAD
jgi:hypothetical protein